MSSYDFDQTDKYVEFILFSKKYQFWYPTTEEAVEMQKIKGDEEMTKAILKYIRVPEGSDSPPFSEVQQKMTLKQTARFKEMIQTELGVEQ